jgi:glutathione S-transferase
MKVRLYSIPGSHPAMAIEQMLRYKGIEYDRTDLIPVVSKLALRTFGFSRTTVPAAKIDGRRIQGSIAIAQHLDELQPQPPLYPADPVHRVTIDQIERFCDVDLQHPIRQAIWWGFRRDRNPMRSYSEGARLGIPIGLAVKTGAPIVALSNHFNRASDDNVRAGLAALPGVLRRLDDWIAEGSLGGVQPYAADFQVAASLRLAMTMDDLRPVIEPRPCGQLALRLIPDYPGHMPPVLPPRWLEPLRGALESAVPTAGF